MAASRIEPAFLPPPGQALFYTHGSLAVGEGTALAPENLARSPAAAGPALAAALAGLCFLEREGWPLKPGRTCWALGPEGFPHILPAAPPAAGPEGAVRECLEVFRIALGLPARNSGRRSHGRRGALAGWLCATLDEISTLPGPGDLLLRLQADIPEAGILTLPSHFCVGFVWKVGAPPGPGLHRWGTASAQKLFRAGLRTAFPGVDSTGPNWAWVSLEGASPYPYGGLEPLIRRLLPPGGGNPQGWLVDRLRAGSGDGAALAADLGALLVGAGIRGLVLEPAEALDPASLLVLEAASPFLSAPLVLLGGEGAPPPLVLASVRFPLLPPLAEAWYIDHLRAIFGPSPAAWLPSLSLLGSGLPRCGAPLLPPLPQGTRESFSPVLGPGRDTTAGTGPKIRSGANRRGAPPAEASGDDAMAEMAARGRIAALWVAACALGDGTQGRFWKGVALLLLGQPGPALASWEGLECEDPALAARLRLQRARAFERAHNFPRALCELDRLNPRDLAERDRPWRNIFRGHLLGLSGQLDEAEGILTDALRVSKDSDARAQTLCHLAALALHGDSPERAFGYLAEAKTAADGASDPTTRFLILHRSGMAHKRTGDYALALKCQEGAVEAARSYGLRRLEAGALCDLGNVLRMTGRMAEAAQAYGQAEEGALGLGLASLAEAARFDRAICLLEGGDNLSAQGVFEDFAGRPASSPLDAAIHAYWLGLALNRRGDLPGALEWADRGLRRLEGISDPEVRLPLLLLRGESLLLSGQGRKVEYLLAEAEASLGPDCEADDVVQACALRALAARPGDGATHGFEERAGAVLSGASPEARCFWKMALAKLRPGRRDILLREALEEARCAPGPHAACLVLAEMAAMGGMPVLGLPERERLRGYIVGNKISGHLRDLLPLLPAEPLAGRKDIPDGGHGPLGLLEAWADGAEGNLALATSHLRASCGCLTHPGAPPEWAGEASGPLREKVAAKAGTRGAFEVAGHQALSAQRTGGPWCAFARHDGDPAWEPEDVSLVNLLARLAPAAPSLPPTPKRVRGPIHPAVETVFLTRSEPMRPVLESITRAASFRYCVLLTGEPGTGKEVCARALHAAWGPKKPYLPFNCANLTPTLAASQLFGHRRGAFTGADKDQAGLVEAARGGILFLDEVGELPGETQAQLLRFLQDGSYLPVGEVHPRTSDARVVAATNRELEAMVASGAFRADLFHRLNVIRVEIPPLRKRPDDVAPLFERFLAEAARESGMEVPTVEGGLLARLAAYPWPGNVRELQNLARSLLVASHGEGAIRESHLPERLRGLGAAPSGGPPTGALAARLAAAEKAAIAEALAESGGNLTRTAKSLGISRQALSQKVKRLGITPR